MKTMIQAAAVTLFAASTVQAQQAVQWKVSDGGNGHWYRLVSGPVGCFAWWQANAESSGAHLASIGSVSEQTFLGGLLPGATGGFVGGIRSPESDVNLGWTWVTGEPFSPTAVSWAPGNPGCCAPNEFWLWLLNNGLHDGAECENGTAAFFEWSADCNGDGIVDYGQCRDGSLPDYDGDNVPDCCEAGSACVTGKYPVQWRVADGGNGHWYQRLTPVANVSWSQASDRCESLGGHLASVLTPSEDAFVHSVVGNTEVFLGGFQPPDACEPACGWTWLTGEAWSFSNWNDFEPNNSNVEQDRLRTYPSGTWDDVQDGEAFPFEIAIEWSADCNSDGIVDYGQILQGQLADTNADGVPDICQGPTCADADIYRDFNVNGADLGILLSQWGPNTPLTESDLNGDGVVNGADLGLLLSFWGACP